MPYEEFWNDPDERPAAIRRPDKGKGAEHGQENTPESAHAGALHR